LQLWDADWSEVLAKQAVWLVGLMGDDLAEEIFLQIGGIAISDTSIGRRVAVWGEKIKAVEEARAATARALPRFGEVVRGEAHSGPRMGAAMDGIMMHVREEGWKELKVGCIYEVEMRREVDKKTAEEKEVPSAVRNSYTALLGGHERFGEAVWAEANRRGLPRAIDTIVLGDGAKWIWKEAQKHFGSSEQAVDWYHAKQHLYQAAYLGYGEGDPKAIRWAKGMEEPLYQGEAQRVASAIRYMAERHSGKRAEQLLKEANYFEQNERRMQYMELREGGWPIGSGMVESGGKRFGARFAGSGMRWSRVGAERLIPVRAAILSGRFDEVWEAAYSPPK